MGNEWASHDYVLQTTGFLPVFELRYIASYVLQRLYIRYSIHTFLYKFTA
jgi:hypothetical protein